MIVHWCWCLVLSGGAIVSDGSISAGACGEIGGGKGGGEIGGALLVVVGSTKKCEAEVFPFSNGGICAVKIIIVIMIIMISSRSSISSVISKSGVIIMSSKIIIISRSRMIIMIMTKILIWQIAPILLHWGRL